jgi:hypothetical protein
MITPDNDVELYVHDAVLQTNTEDTSCKGIYCSNSCEAHSIDSSNIATNTSTCRYSTALHAIVRRAALSGTTQQYIVQQQCSGAHS